RSRCGRQRDRQRDRQRGRPVLATGRCAMSRPWLLGNTVRGRPRRRRPCSRERGSGTVFVIGFSAWVLTVGFTVAATGAADVTQHRADVAAELAALSAVARVSQPGGSCGAAADIASAHGAV